MSIVAQRSRLFLAAVIVLVISVAPGFALAADAPRNFSELANLLVKILSVATQTAIAGVFAFYFFSIARDMQRVSEGETSLLKQYFVWGILALFVMISVGGILALLENQFFGSSSSMTGGSIPIDLGE